VSRGTLISVAFATAVLLISAAQGSVSADDKILPPTTTTVVKQFDEESGIIWAQIDDHTIEISLPD
jgi:hypothetical protein